MSKDKIYIFDTTLRDGAQTEGVDFSVEDKNKIASAHYSLLPFLRCPTACVRVR